MPMAMPMTVAVPAGPVWPLAEAAIGHALASHDRTSVQAGRYLTKKSRTAVTLFHKSHRYDADGPTPDQGQDDAAGAFHVGGLGADSMLDRHLGMRAGAGQAKAKYLTGSCGATTGCPQPPPEKCAAKACANPPKPPRVTPLEPGSAEVPDDERLDEASPKKLLRDDDPPEPPRPPLEEDPRGEHSAPDCGNDGAAIPAPFGSHVSPGNSANALPPTASVLIRRSATCRERFTG
jgi:hypothetical protein